VHKFSKTVEVTSHF